MKLQQILKDTNYSLNLFTDAEIANLESRIYSKEIRAVEIAIDEDENAAMTYIEAMTR
jgi:hypothetical protein